MTILIASPMQRQYWDLAGISASVLCVTHCLVAPFLAVFLPALELFERQTHASFALAILSIGLLAFWPGYLRHRRWRIVAAAIAGFGLISLGVTMPEGLLTERAETLTTLIGGGVLILAHLRNAYFCRSCRHCGDRACTST